VSEIPSAVEIVEGSTRVLVPKQHTLKGPGKRLGGVFYNQQTAFSRDVSVMFFGALKFEGKALDGLAGTGVRAVRIANESPGDFEFIINDRSKEAFEYIKRNIDLNGLENCIPCQSDVRILLCEQTFDYIDIDPFGSPVPFVQLGIEGCKRRGILGITATDTAPLAGTYPDKCLRRYGAKPFRCAFGHEIGLRILIGYLAREAAKFERGIKPVLCFYADHYFRVHIQLLEGAQYADQSLRTLGSIGYDENSKERKFPATDDLEQIGPLWLGRLFDKELLVRMIPYDFLHCKNRCAKYLKIWKEELDELPYFYDVDEISSILKISPPPLNDILEELRKSGKASRTHFSPRGFKTDLTLKEVLERVEEIAK
jgi:tRNA (guanine26-N2/guanine27-N2)-dimethyltransferase